MNERVKPERRAGAKRRGRPRNEALRRAALQGARELLNEAGAGAVTMEAVAARSGVGKPTLYRWWPDRHALLMTALMEEGKASDAATSYSQRPAIRALRDQLRAIVRRFAQPSGRHIASLIAAADRDSELSKAFRNHFVLARRTEGKALLEQAVERAEIRASVDLEIALDLLYGPLFFRLLMGHAPLDERFADEVIRHAMRGFRPRLSRKRPPKKKAPKPIKASGLGE